MTVIVQPETERKGRFLFVWDMGDTDITAELARLAVPGGVQPADDVTVVSWLKQGEEKPTPPWEFETEAGQAQKAGGEVGSD